MRWKDFRWKKQVTYCFIASNYTFYTGRSLEFTTYVCNVAKDRNEKMFKVLSWFWLGNIYFSFVEARDVVFWIFNENSGDNTNILAIAVQCKSLAASAKFINTCFQAIECIFIYI